MDKLDKNYFKKKLELILRDLDQYTPVELSTDLLRLSKTAFESPSVKPLPVIKMSKELPTDEGHYFWCLHGTKHDFVHDFKIVDIEGGFVFHNGNEIGELLNIGGYWAPVSNQVEIED
jgi:hypothetical protein